ncbi:uncharacterized protein LOC127261677 [Andrographis paniculata]|uniref:uncharacterized protein LOC127261677 n=1 Tax=Andrographis paniculata TaxID=175694 RepID=UPI0021E6DE5C|nr:uncharacterized protein LOC127261677 [Andrographis paniculata]
MARNMKKQNLAVNDLNNIAQFLLQGSTNGKSVHGKITEAILKYSVSRQVIHRIWKRAHEQIQSGQPISLKNKKSDLPRVKRKEFDKTALQSIAVHKRDTYTNIAKEMNVSKSIVGNRVKSGLIRPHTNAIKPSLNEKNKIERLKFSLNSLQIDSASKVIKFQSMSQVVHVDKKWFNLTRETKIYYLLPDEPEPYKVCHSKRFITKVMFLCAVVRPMYASNGECIFDGKIDIFPFTEKVPAQRNSKNRTIGTIVTKPLESITKKVTKKLLINKVIPAIKEKWPTNRDKNITIQQDNAKQHINNSDLDFR